MRKYFKCYICSMKRNPQLSSTVTPELYEQVEALAKEDTRSISEMVFLLLQQAVKERLRRRKNGSKENNTANNSTNERPSDAG